MSVTLADTRSSQLVLEHIESLIQAESLGPGDRLPTERALEQSLGCSRTDIRRAFAQLTLDGRVVRHTGRGTFLAPTPAARDIVTSPADLMAARALLEPRVVATAAITATAADFAEMQRCLDGGDGASEFEEFEAWDLALHRSFASATHNGVVEAMVDILHSARNDPSWGGLKRRTFSAARCAKYRAEHKAIVDALRDRDAVAAEAAMTEHLTSIRYTILG